MTLSELTFLILNLNSLVDGGYHEGVPMEEAKTHIDRGDVFDWLSQKFAGHIDLSDASMTAKELPCLSETGPVPGSALMASLEVQHPMSKAKIPAPVSSGKCTPAKGGGGPFLRPG